MRGEGESESESKGSTNGIVNFFHCRFTKHSYKSVFTRAHLFYLLSFIIYLFSLSLFFFDLFF